MIRILSMINNRFEQFYLYLMKRFFLERNLRRCLFVTFGTMTLEFQLSVKLQSLGRPAMAMAWLGREEERIY